MYDPARDVFAASDDTLADQTKPNELEAAEHSSTEPPPVEQLHKKAQAEEDSVDRGKKAYPAKVRHFVC